MANNNITYSNIELAKRIHKSACIVSVQEELLDQKIDDTKTEIIEAIKDIDDTVTALSNKVLDLDVTIGSNFVTNIEVGGIKAGTEIEDTDKLKQILINMLLTLKYAEKVKDPSCSIYIGTSGTTTSITDEIGTTVSPVFRLVYSDGQFKSYSNNGNTVSNIDAWCSHDNSKDVYEIKDGSTWKQHTNGSSIKLKGSAISVRGKCTYGDSTASPTNSNGTTATNDGKEKLVISGGTCTSGNCTLTGKYGIFYKALSVEPGTVTRDTFGKPVNWISKSTFRFNFNDKIVYVAIPKLYTLDSAISTANEGQVWVESEIKLADAGGDKHDYKLYKFTYSAEGGLGLEVDCKIV